jgi:hypothetical protein
MTKQVEIFDQTQGRMPLFLPGLDALLRAGFALRLVTAQNTRHFIERVVPGGAAIKWGKTAEEQVRMQVALGDRPEMAQRADARHIVFPLLPEDLAGQYEKWVGRENVVPLGGETILAHAIGDVPSLVDFLHRAFSPRKLAGKKVLVTAGPTAEDLDPVRFLTNRSSGKMGIALARAAFIAGADVQLVLGPTTVAVPRYLAVQRVRSAQEMARAVLQAAPQFDVYIGAAAVADFTPAVREDEKIKKSENGLQIRLKRTTDILKALSELPRHPLLVGFSVETENVRPNSLKKLKRKNLDMIIANNPKEAGAAFGVDTNKVTLLTADGQSEEWPLMSKMQVSEKIMERIAKVLNR